MRKGAFALTCALAALAALPAAADPLVVEAEPIEHFHSLDDGARDFGRLRFLGGSILTSEDRRFGGISGIEISADGRTLTGVTDRGKWLRARIALAGAGNPVLQAVEMAPMLDTAGAPLRSKYNSDAEAIAAIPARAGRFAVSFERADRIWTYDIGEHGLSAPAGDPGAAIGAFPTNHGVEAIVALPRSSPLGAAIIAFAEGASGGVIPGFILGGTRPGRFSIVPHEEFDVTDAALGPDGAIYLLHRYFTVLRGPMMAISRLRPDDIAPGARLTTELLMHANVTHEIDNMEALAAHEGADGNTVLTLMSDNNFNALQRTLLLRFSVME